MSIDQCPDNWPALNRFNVDQWLGVDILHRPEIAHTDIGEVYLRRGSHPEVVERVWDQLGASLPDRCCSIVHGTICLLHDQTSLLLAICMGTEYAIRVPTNVVDHARAQGLVQTCDWTGGGHTNLGEELGSNWFFGQFNKHESAWVELAYKQSLSD